MAAPWDGKLQTYLGSGTLAARPATPNIATGMAAFYYGTDTLAMYAYVSGTGWSTVTGSGGSGALTLITETVTSGSATNVSFTSIASTWRDLVVRINGRGTKTASLVDLRMRFNADTGANYDTHSTQVNGTSAANNFINAGGTSVYLGNIAAASAPSGYADFIELRIGDYKGTTFHKTGRKEGGTKINSGGASGWYYIENGSFWWLSTAAITQIDVFPSANGFVDGTVISLYGRS